MSDQEFELTEAEKADFARGKWTKKAFDFYFGQNGFCLTQRNAQLLKEYDAQQTTLLKSTKNAQVDGDYFTKMETPLGAQDPTAGGNVHMDEFKPEDELTQPYDAELNAIGWQIQGLAPRHPIQQDPMGGLLTGSPDSMPHRDHGFDLDAQLSGHRWRPDKEQPSNQGRFAHSDDFSEDIPDLDTASALKRRMSGVRLDSDEMR